MPAISTVTSPNLTPPPEMNPSIAGRPGQVMAGAAQELSQVSDFGMQVADRIKKAQDEGILLGAENNITADIEKAHAGLANWTDYTNADQLKQDTATALREKYVDKYGNRPDLWRFIEPYLGKELNSYNGVVDQKAAQLTSHFNKSALFDSQLHAENEAATEPTLDGKERIWAIQDAKTDAMVRNGTLWADEGEQAKKLLRSRTISAEVERASNPLNAPEIMESEMARLKEYEGKGYVDPTELERINDHLSVAYERALNRSDRVDVSKQGDAVLSSVKNDPTLKDPETREFDHLAAAKKIDDDPSIPTKVKKYVRTELEEEAGATQKLSNDRDQKMLDSLDPNVESGALTFAELTRRENLAPGQPDWIPRRVADHLLTRAAQIQRENRVTNMQERGLIRQERMDKSAEIRDQLLSDPGYIADQNELTPYRLKGLSAGDANIVWKVRALNSDPAWKLAVETMNKSSLYDQATDEGRAKLSKDLIQFAHTVENKKLTGSQITDELQKELHPQEEAQKSQNVRLMLDNVLYKVGRALTPQFVYPGPPAQPNQFMVVPNPKGLVESGNLPIWNRPTVQNADGTHSSEYSTSFEKDGKEVLVPTIVNGRFLTPDGKKPPEGSEAEKAMFAAARQHYLDTGEHLGKFDNPEDADTYAEQLHNRGSVPPRAPQNPKKGDIYNGFTFDGNGWTK